MAKGRIEQYDVVSKEALATVDTLSINLKRSLDAMDGLIANGKKLNDSLVASPGIKELNKLIEEQIRNLGLLRTEKDNVDKKNKELVTAQNKLTQEAIAEAQARRELKAQLEAQAVLENKEAGTLAKLAAENKKLTLERKNLNLETVQGKARLQEINATLDKNNAVIKDNVSGLEKQRLNIGNYKSALEGLPGPLGSAASGVSRLGDTFKKLIANPVVLVITAIVGALYGLFKMFKSTDAGATELEARFGQLKAILEVLKERVLTLTSGIGHLFKLQFKQAAEDFRDSVAGVGDQLKSAAKGAYEFAYAMDDLVDRQIAFISKEAEMKNQIERLLNISKDQTKSDKARMDALEQALKLEDELAKKKVQFAKQEYDNNLAALASTLNMDKARLDSFIKLGDDEAMAARKTNADLENAWNLYSENKIKTLEELYAKSINADTEYYASTKRAVSQLSSLQVQLAREREAENKRVTDEAKKLSDERIKNEVDTQKVISELRKSQISDLDSYLQQGINALQEFNNDWTAINLENLATQNANELALLAQKRNANLISQEEYEKQRLALVEKYRRQVIEEQIAQAESVLRNENTSANDRAKTEKDLADYRKQLEEDVTDKNKEENEKRKAQTKKISDETVKLISEAVSASFEIKLNGLEEENQQLEKQKEYELSLAGDNATKKEQIEARFAKQSAEIKAKQAKVERNQALFQIGIETAKNAVSLFAETVPPGILSLLAIAFGAIQAGVVLSKPLPQYAKGRKGGPAELAIVGERGSELLIDAYGGVQVSPDRPTLTYLKAGTSVIPHRETETIIQKAIVEKAEGQPIDFTPVVNAIKNKREYYFNFHDNGIDITEREGNYFKNYLNRFRL